jgi:hypothetical protein
MSDSHGHENFASADLMSEDRLRAGMNRVQKLALALGVIFLGIPTAAAIVMPSSQAEAFFRTYLFAYMFWWGLAMACGGITMIHNLTGGKWGQAGRRILVAGSGTMYVMAFLAIPFLVCVVTKHVYWWTDMIKPLPEGVGPHKQQFFDPKNVLSRGVIYFIIWLIIPTVVIMGSRHVERTGRWAVARVYAAISGVLLILYVLSVTFAAVDWTMSLTPQWESTMYALIFVAGQCLSAFAFTLLVLSILVRYEPQGRSVTLDQFNDLASFMFTFTILWAYMSFGQLLISYMGNLKDEMLWYVPRVTGAWEIPGISLMLFQFLLPFLLLLMKPIKRNPPLLMKIAVLIMLMRLVDIFWTIKPAFADHQLSWMDPLIPIGIGGFFVAAFIWRLKCFPLTLPPLITEHTAVEARGVAFEGATEYGAAISRRKGPVP